MSNNNLFFNKNYELIIFWTCDHQGEQCHVPSGCGGQYWGSAGMPLPPAPAEPHCWCLSRSSSPGPGSNRIPLCLLHWNTIRKNRRPYFCHLWCNPEQEGLLCTLVGVYFPFYCMPELRDPPVMNPFSFLTHTVRSLLFAWARTRCCNTTQK